MTVRIFGGTDMQLGRTDMVRVRAQRNLGETDYTNSVGPILVMSQPGSLHCNLGSTDCSKSVRPILIMDIHREITIPSR